MAMSSKFDLSSDSPDRPIYSSGHRGSHLAAQMDRSSSFRESMENPILSSLPNMTRSSAVVAQGDMVKFLQCIPFDPKVMAAEHKSSRQGDFKRHMNTALGISADDSPGSLKGKVALSPSPEEIKRVRDGLFGSLVKGRERMKIFNEALFEFNKFFPNILPKKRSRLEGYSNDRPNASVSSDRSVLGPSMGKIGIQNHSATSGFEPEQQKSEERTKNIVPNKRTRTSLVDVRGNALVRPSGTVDRDREMPRLANSGAVQGEDRSLSIGVDGWEKTKMKKKRSGIKPEVASNVVSAKPSDGYRESKQGVQQRPVTDARSRLNIDSHGFRPGVYNGAVGVGKIDGMSQPTGLSVRSMTPRADLENNSLLNDRRERPHGSDKERVNIRSVNKASVRDDFNSASPTSSAKMNPSIRAPRSGSGIMPKLSPVVHRATAPNDWELSHCTNKPPAVGANNRKRTASARSSSPPVAHWASQRPQKISRTARRTNLVPIANNDESPTLDSVSDVSGNEIGVGFARRLSGNSPQQVKLKGDTLSSAVLSESEESGATEVKSKDKSRKPDEMDEKVGHNVQKISPLGPPSRKNKLVSGEDFGDGVRRQGRTGRGFTSTRSVVPTAIEKLGNVGTAKQLRSARIGFDKNESKTGRPPTRKLSDRKAYTRQKNTTVIATADFLVGSEDGHEELLAAASAVINPDQAFSSSFWRQMEPFFGFISDVDFAHLKPQGSIVSTAPSATPVHSDVNNYSTVPNGYGLFELDRKLELAAETRTSELLPYQLMPVDREIPLSQLLLAALTSEEDCTLGNGDLEFDAYGTDLELNEELGSNCVNHLDNFQFSGHAAFSGCKVSGKPDHDETDIDISGTPNMGVNSNFRNTRNGVLSDHALVPGMACSKFQYDNMKIEEKLHLEVLSLGIFPESMPDMQMDDEGICGHIRKLEENQHGLVSKKKSLLDKLLKHASEMKELQEKEFEHRAHDKLVTMAYEKYMTCWGPNVTGGKSSSSKMAKQAALAFVKRTLERCHKFEVTGNSCFSEPSFRDVFLSGTARLNGPQSVDTPIDGESAKLYGNTSTRSLEARVSASMGSQPSPRTSHLGQNGDSHIADPSDLLPPVNRLSEQITGKEDMWSNRVKKRELLLDDVGGAVGSPSNAPSGIGGSLSSSTKGKRSERDREGKGHNREVLSRNGTNKIGRPTLSNQKGERKTKSKPKQKTTQLSVSVNGLVGKISEQPRTTLPSEEKSSENNSNSKAKEKDRFGLDALDVDLSNLQLPGIDVLDDSQGQDLGSWLNIDDDGLQEHGDIDCMGLEIPMDDLSDLNMMV
ncbi:Serine/arginine repetitive matrix protein [Salix suchowensis]|nr:Serine/arginine repetitive matrix protein [Salix suchowensis]